MDANKKLFQIGLAAGFRNACRPFLVPLFLLVSIATLSGAEELFLEGNARFAEKKYAEAAEFYEQALRKGSSANLYYNAGLAALKLGESGRARLQWERALTLEPPAPTGAPEPPSAASRSRFAGNGNGIDRIDENGFFARFSEYKKRLL